MILDSDYPSNDNLYGNVFVHTRVKEYQKHAVVQVVSFFRNQENYEFDGVKVLHALTVADIERLYKEFRPDHIYIHFYHRKLFEFIKQVSVSVIIWVHGYEALGWYRRLFNYTINGFIRNGHNIIISNIRQMIGFRKLVCFSNRNDRVHFVFVSKWMRDIAQMDSLIKVKNYSIIPNPINTELFQYNKKEGSNRKKILMIRSFNSRKYATDIAIKSILLLSKKDFFSDLQFEIYGRGKYFKSQTLPLQGMKNVFLHERFLLNKLIPEIHKDNGLFLCPTRQDAQGVSMCEAMSSGLVPITSISTAIPEFVNHLNTGLLSKNADELAKQIELLYKTPMLFLSISSNTASFIREKCAIKNVIEKELAIP